MATGGTAAAAALSPSEEASLLEQIGSIENVFELLSDNGAESFALRQKKKYQTLTFMVSKYAMAELAYQVFDIAYKTVEVACRSAGPARAAGRREARGHSADSEGGEAMSNRLQPPKM